MGSSWAGIGSIGDAEDMLGRGWREREETGWQRKWEGRGCVRRWRSGKRVRRKQGRTVYVSKRGGLDSSAAAAGRAGTAQSPLGHFSTLSVPYTSLLSTMSDAPLPPGWIKEWDSNYNQFYFVGQSSSLSFSLFCFSLPDLTSLPLCARHKLPQPPADLDPPLSLWCSPLPAAALLLGPVVPLPRPATTTAVLLLHSPAVLRPNTFVPAVVRPRSSVELLQLHSQSEPVSRSAAAAERPAALLGECREDGDVHSGSGVWKGAHTTHTLFFSSSSLQVALARSIALGH